MSDEESAPDPIVTMTAGPLAGRTLRELQQKHPDELVGRSWRGPCFPVMTKFIDGYGMLPVHLHADDRTAQGKEGEPNGKTEAWHILEAGPGATALIGLKPGVGMDTLREVLIAQDWDRVMRRVPVRAGETVYVPGGTLHSFGPRTLIYEIEQMSNIQQHAMPRNMEDGLRVEPKERERNIDALLEEIRPDPRPNFQPGLRLPVSNDIERTILCAGPYFALERWRVTGDTPWHYRFDHATVLSNVGLPLTVRAGTWADALGRAETLLLPAALGEVTITGPADVLIGYLPDLERDIRSPLAAAGYGPEVIASLGEM